MQLGIHVNTFRRPSLAATLDAVAEHGLQCVHFNMTVAGFPAMPESMNYSACRQIAKELAARHISMATLSGTFNMIHPNRKMRRRGLELLAVIAMIAEPLGTSLIALCTGTRDPDNMWRYHPENDDRKAWRDLVVSMDEALEVAEACNVTLAIEPEVSNVVDSALKARRLLDEMGSDRLKIIIDGANLFHTGQLAWMREVLDEAFELLGEDIVVAHAKDLNHDGEAGQVPAGQGVLDYDHYLSLLEKIGFDGPLILHSLSEADVPACVEFLRKKVPGTKFD